MRGSDWIGFATLAAGVVLFFTSRWERDRLPRWFDRLPIAVVALGLSTIFLAREGLAWSVLSAGCSLVAIVTLVLVIRDILRR